MHMELMECNDAIRTIVVYTKGSKTQEIELTLNSLAPVGSAVELFGRYWEVDRIVFPANAPMEFARMYVFAI